MKNILLLVFVIALTACGPSESTETVESLASNPDRLKAASAMQAGSRQAGRCVVQPGGRSHAQALLW
jgi:hypothetical protein